MTIEYTGTFNRMYYSDCQTYSTYGSCNSWNFTDQSTSSFFDGLVISVGDQFTGSFSYNANALLSGISSDGYQAVYLQSIYNSTLSSNIFSLPMNTLSSTGNGDYSVVNGRYGWDSFYVASYFSNPSWFTGIIFNPMDHDGTVFSDFTAPSELELSDFESPYFSMFFLRKSDGDQLQIRGTLSSISTIAPVPEPSTILLLGAGLAGIGLYERRQRK